MKTALLAIAAIATASVAMADDDQYAIVDKEQRGNGQVEIVTQVDGNYTLWLVNCLPMKSAVVDREDSFDDLQRNGSADLQDVIRGTVEHDIAVAACSA